MALTELQRKQLIEKINSLPVKTILPYFLEKEISFEDVPHIEEERKRWIEEQVNSMPNPNEQREWNGIANLISGAANIMQQQEVLQMLETYINNWDAQRPTGNHVDEARDIYARLKSEIDVTIKGEEDRDWERVDMFSKASLIGHLSKYPDTAHRSEIDDAVWNLVNKESELDIREYRELFINGNHYMEATELYNAIVRWSEVKSLNDIFAVHQYLQENPNTPYKFQAQTLYISLKQNEIREMLTRNTEYDAERLIRIINEGVISENEIINSKVVTKPVLETLKSLRTIHGDLPDIRVAINNSMAECKEGYTDVYFFGVPSTGKTCVLMGLSRSDSLHINLAAGGGDYASALQQYTDVGITVPRTPGTFVTTLEATISSRAANGVEHKVNLVEMSGEEFAFSIANNPEHIFEFEDMGSGATKLLKNNNRKVFFLIIDPTANVVRINREIVDGYDENTGAPITHLEYCVVNQRTLIQKMVNIFENPGNAEIMKKVDSIHIIMTKSDTLGNAVEREEKAYEIFNNKFGHHILEPLINLCKEYNINTSTKFHPKLYTFSLGTFYIGGLYEYEQTDSNRLVHAIKNATHGEKQRTWWDRLKDVLN